MCVVGSGAGGSVIAAQAAAAGKSVLVLEAGQYRNEQDFNQLEIQGYQELYYGGGLATSEDGSISILAGATLGGGTVVNYMNCIPTPERIISEWSGHGLEGMDDPAAYTRDHIETVLERLGANTEATKQNGTHTRLMAGLDALGHEHRPIVRNASLDDDAEMCGYCTVGCQHGLQALGHEDVAPGRVGLGRPAPWWAAPPSGSWPRTAPPPASQATVTHADGSTTALTVEAPTVVVACGSIESPALLLRSGIGGPAVGKHLRVHPAYVVMGTYDEPVEGWRGQIQSLVSDAYADLEGGFGFLIEGTSVQPGFLSPALPWGDGRTHKELMQTLRWQAPFITVARDHGSGEVVLDDLGRAVMRWGLGDEVDARLAVRAHVELCRLHQAAGAAEVFTTHESGMRWQRGRRLRRVPRARGGGLLRAQRRGLLHRPPDGLVPHGQRSARRRWPTAAASCTTPRACGSATPRRSPRRRA